MSGAQLVAVGLLVLAGFLIGGVISFGRERRWIPAGILALLSVLAAVAAVLRLV
ncbi:hypothetical protein GCM10023201_08420 [Actinomycetospora corticicola]|uniref:Uncharacterized protein n=1 Tax=Actinomycetospora corticicola TaxID=663602 RepID=A0A7Y9DTP6_9PSEU|nr:hypothetical protein [Actinomycetospora corticicola]NYD35322.1 hypothetical protein [Actinomycetospora corticicola]